MKTLLISIIIALAVSVSMGQNKVGQAGEKALLFTFSGFSDLGVHNVNGGAGIRYYPATGVSLRGTLGTTVVTGNDQNATSANVSGAILFDLGSTSNTNVYLGPVVTYQHADPNLNSYQIGGVLGGEFFPWQHVSLSAEYVLGVTRDPEHDITNWKFGDTGGGVGLALWF